MSNEDDPAYRVEAKEEGDKVLSDAGYTIMVCHDEPSAIHYATLLTEAFKRGYKAGYRAAKQSN